MARKKRAAAKKKAAKKAKKSGLKKTRPRKRVGPARLKASTRKGGVGPSPVPAAVTQPEPASPQPPALTLEAIDAFRVLSEVIQLREEAARDRNENRESRQLVLQKLNDIDERAKRYEELQRPVAEDKSVAAVISGLRLRFVGGCAALGIRSPTPAIIGRAMHDAQAFSKNEAVTIVPRAIFEAIYAKKAKGIPDHLSPEITSLLENHTPENSGRTARLLGEEFDARFQVIANEKLGEKSAIRSGRKMRYRRVLGEWGARVFRQWPDWNDPSGGLSLGVPHPRVSAEPGPEPEPERPASSPGSPAALGLAAVEAPAPPAGSFDTPASESPDSPNSPPTSRQPPPPSPT
jgi:hypothetical protein